MALSASLLNHPLLLPAIGLGLSSIIMILSLARIWKAATGPLKSVPGPFFARFTRLWYLHKVWQGHFEKINIKLHEEHGPIVRIAPDQYSIDDEESIKTIYGHGTKFTKGPWYYASGPPNPHVYDLFTDRDSKRHSENRKKVAQLYSMTTLVKYEPFVTECTTKILVTFNEFAKRGESINLQHWFQCYALDLIGHITVAKRFGFLDKGEDQGGLLKSLQIYLTYCANVGIYSGIHPFLSWIMSFTPLLGMSYMASFTQEQISDRLNSSNAVEKKEMNDFLTKLLKIHSEQPDKISMGDVFTACITNIGAGSDTTSISLSGILYHLLKNPEVLAKLRSEIDAKDNAHQLSDFISFKEAQELRYLQACIKEGLRMHPATGLPLQRVVPNGGATICGKFFPEGALVGVNTWVAHQNKAVFGEDAHLFRPERWLESAERNSSMERYFMTFGAGSRTCIGKNISLLEISKLVPELVRRYDITLLNPQDALKTHNVWFVKQLNLNCRISLRPKN